MHLSYQVETNGFEFSSKCPFRILDNSFLVNSFLMLLVLLFNGSLIVVVIRTRIFTILIRLLLSLALLLPLLMPLLSLLSLLLALASLSLLLSLPLSLSL